MEKSSYPPAAIQQAMGFDPYCGSVSVAFMSELDDPDLACT
jgi:hypothetical protein